MQFIKVHKDTLPKSRCAEIIEYFKKNNAAKVAEQYKQRNPIVNELTVTDLNDDFWTKLETDLQDTCKSYLKDYLEFSKHNVDSFFFEHLSIMQYKESSGRKPHCDCEFDYRDGEHMLRLFAVLIYLNDDFDGGEVVFPTQKVVQKPEPGLMVIFPTSFMYPHFTIPHTNNERFVLRMHYYLKLDEIL